MKASDHDDETFQPHSHVDDQGDEEDHEKIAAEFSYPEELGDKKIADEQRPIEWRVWALQAVEHHIALELTAGVPGGETLHEIAVTNDQPDREHHTDHVVNVARRD